jgi:alkylation response protein AidB-like acyl-CoA dehydrogenase
VYFAPSDDQEAIRETTRTFLEKTSTPSEVRRLMETETGFDPSVWRALASDLGLVGLLIPERYGGAGLGFIELALVMQEMGRALLCTPYLSSAVLAPLALEQLGDDETRERLLPAIAAGGARAAVTLPAGPRELAAGDLHVRAKPDGAAFRLHGRAQFVIDGASADVVLVLAGDDHARSRLFAVESGAGGLARTPLDTLDATRKQADLDFEGVEASAAGPPASPESLARVLAGAAVALAAEQAGGAERTLEDAVSYAQLRQQFGRPIGSFQAVKHKCADMLMAAESAKTAAWYAAWAMATGADGAVAASRVAKAICSEAFLSNAGENLQVHGGIGFTWECDAHLHLKRARSSWALFGAPPELRELTADAMELR